MIARGLGCLPDAPGARGTHGFLDVCGARLSWSETKGHPVFGINTQSSLDLSHLCAPPSNQGGSNTCYAHAWANAITQAARRTNPTFERPSQLLIADMTRGMLGQRDVDVGAPLSVVEIALRNNGFAAESVVPWDESRLFDHLYADEYQAAIMQIGLRSHRVLTNPRASIKAALSAGRGVVVGMDVDQKFMDLGTSGNRGTLEDLHINGGVWPGLSGEVVGGHAMSICGYADEGVYIINSWGTSWNDCGFGWIAWGYIESNHCHSAWIVDAAPEYWRGQ